MKRPTTTNATHEEDASDCFSSTAPNSNQTYLDENTSPYNSYNNDNDNISDSETLSEDSKKIRKKRNAYQKISDDIRVKLLESVKNGETLKSAAKRFKINYSSAKSILHTFRKEGRILKKSAQERTTKKRSISSIEHDSGSKALKPSKKENIVCDENSEKLAQPLVPLNKRAKSENVSNRVEDEPTFAAPLTRVDDNCMSYNKTDNHDYQSDKFDMKNSSAFLPNTSYPVEKENEPVMRVLAAMDNEDWGDMHCLEAIRNQKIRRLSFQEENALYKLKLFDSFHVNHPDGHFYEIGNPMLAEGPEHTNYVFFPREFDCLNTDIFNGQPKPLVDDNHNELFSFGGQNVDKINKTENETDNHQDSGENIYGNCPLKSFMDTQNLFRNALRKASFFSVTSNGTGYRKGSMDLFQV